MPTNSITSGLGSLLNQPIVEHLQAVSGMNYITYSGSPPTPINGSQNIFIGSNTGTYWMWYGNMERPKKRKLVLRLP